MNRITRDHYLSREEAERYQKVREQVEEELPELLARHAERMNVGSTAELQQQIEQLLTSIENSAMINQWDKPMRDLAKIVYQLAVHIATLEVRERTAELASKIFVGRGQHSPFWNGGTKSCKDKNCPLCYEPLVPPMATGGMMGSSEARELRDPCGWCGTLTDKHEPHCAYEKPSSEEAREIEQLLSLEALTLLKALAAGWEFRRADHTGNEWMWQLEKTSSIKASSNAINELWGNGYIRLLRDSGGAEISSQGVEYWMKIAQGQDKIEIDESVDLCFNSPIRSR